jgi:death-on-curing protein
VDIRFLTLAEVVAIHADQVGRYGGAAEIRDLAGLLSALAMPEAGIGEERFHAFPFEMAAAYAFHICLNHPFVDGNKRTGLAAALIFLRLNGVTVSDPQERLFEVMMGVAAGEATKAQLAETFASLGVEA